jgi:hypothetical protein
MVKKERVRILKPMAGKKANSKEDSVQKQLIENMIHLQKVHTDMAEKFDKLSRQISELLVLFEMAARSFSKQQISPIITDRDKEFVEKVDKLLDQNKTIAKGLTLMEERIRERTGMNESNSQSQMPQMPAQPVQQQSSQFQMSRQMMPSQPVRQIEQAPQSEPAQEEELSVVNKSAETNKEDGNPTPPVSRPLPRF